MFTQFQDQGTCLGPYEACKVPGWSNIRRNSSQPSNMEHKETLLGRLASGEVILGDGSYIMTLEKRGYATAGMWTPEAAAEHPQAVEQLAVEFARAGADITQTFTFWCHEDALPKGCKFSVSILLIIYWLI